MQTQVRIRTVALSAAVGLVASFIAATAPAQTGPLSSANAAYSRDTVSPSEPSSAAISGSNAVSGRPAARFSDRRQNSADLASTLAINSILKPVDKSSSAPWFSPLASLVVPGTGQALLKQQRSVAYLVAEGFLALRAVQSHRDRNTAKAQYQKLAADVARAGFGTDRPTGPWDYYEILEHHSSSGAYNMATSGPFTPESDESTYNGQQWLIARQIFWSSPDQPPPTSSAEYQRALERYQKNALQGSYRFSWKQQTNVQNEYILSIAEANRSSQQLVSTFGLLAANHLASMVDAYITVRLRKFGGAGLVGASVRTELRPTGGFGDNSYGAAMTLSVPVRSGAPRR